MESEPSFSSSSPSRSPRPSGEGSPRGRAAVSALAALSAAAALSLAIPTAALAQTTPLDTTPSADTARPDSAAVKAAAAAAADSAEARAPIRWNAPPPAARDTTSRHAKPFLVMARSAIVPGWGQVYNRQPLKAVVVVAGEGFLAYQIFRELERENDAIDRRLAAIPDSPEYFAADADKETHYNLKVNWIWWTAAAHLLQMADAYVDAHFLDFDAEFGPDDDRSSSKGAPRLRLSLNVRF